MVESAAIFRLHGPAYRATCGDRLRPSPLRAMQDIERCRTEPLGGQVDHGETCHASHDRDHSCKNRHCPTCPPEQAEAGLAQQKRLRLPVPHVMVTLTLPAARSALARRHHKTLDQILFRRASAALQALALDRRCIGGQLGMVGVLQTWTRDLRDHPHGHDLGAGGGLSAEDTGRPSRQDCLVHVTPLSLLFRAQFRDHRHKTARCPRVDAPVWHKDWVVHGKPVGSGAEAFRYLAPDSLRVAIRHKHLLTLADGHVTCPYQASATHQTHSPTVPAQACLRRFLQHGLPDRCINVRDDGFLSPGNRHLRTKVSQ